MSIIIKLIYWAVIGGFLAMSLVSVYNLTIYYRTKRNGKFAEGTVVGLKEKSNILIGMGTPIYQEPLKLVYPIIEYTDADGNTVRAVYRGFVMKGKGTYTEGKQVQIKYDPFRPNEIIITGDNNFHGNHWISAVVGVVFAAFCVFMYRASLF